MSSKVYATITLYDALHLCRIGEMDSHVEYVAGEED